MIKEKEQRVNFWRDELDGSGLNWWIVFIPEYQHVYRIDQLQELQSVIIYDSSVREQSTVLKMLDEIIHYRLLKLWIE